MGEQIQPRDLAHLFYDHDWQDALALVSITSVCLAESQGYDKAYHDNVDDTGKVTSRDVGILQINIPASQIGTKVEQDLYDINNNADAGRGLYANRGFQPWSAYNSGVYLHDVYMNRALRGVANFLGEHFIGVMEAAGNKTNMIVPTFYFNTFPKRYIHA
jgi:hypothetical protein